MNSDYSYEIKFVLDNSRLSDAIKCLYIFLMMLVYE
jgi:hypothetical protein